MESLHHLIFGLGIALIPQNIVYCFLGVLYGTLTGVLPGFGPSAAIAILVNIPGEAASVVTCLDGYQMAKQGRAGPAIGIAAFGSFIAGIIGVIGLMALGPPLADFALKFGPLEFICLIILGLSMVSLLSTGSTIKALIMAAFGLFLGTIGVDPEYGGFRFTFGLTVLSDGVGLIPAVMGLFGISEILLNVEAGEGASSIVQAKIQNMLPSFKDWMESKWAILRGSLIGFFLGLLPGGGAMLASFVSYTVEKKFSKHPERFGHGAIEGVAGPESANNAAAQSAFIPLLTLGLPSNTVTAILLGALMIHGVIPGPVLISQNPEIFWGVIASMILGNAMLLVLNLPLIPLWVKVLRIPYSYLFPLILLFCVVGVYTIANNPADVIVMLVLGVIGYGLRKLRYEPAPLVLALVLGPLFERSVIQGLKITYGNLWMLFTRPICLGLLFITVLFLFIPYLMKFKQKAVDSGFKE